MMMRRIPLFSLAFILFCVSFANAQDIDDNGYNYNSVRPIRRADIHYLKTVWRRMDLREKQNEPFFSTNNELTRVIIDAVKAGVLRGFKNDSLNTRMTLKEFSENLRLPGADEGFLKKILKWALVLTTTLGAAEVAEAGAMTQAEAAGVAQVAAETLGVMVEVATAVPLVMVAAELLQVKKKSILLHRFHILRLKEDIIFDRKRSRIYYDIQAITLIIPG